MYAGLTTQGMHNLRGSPQYTKNKEGRKRGNTKIIVGGDPLGGREGKSQTTNKEFPKIRMRKQQNTQRNREIHDP